MSVTYSASLSLPGVTYASTQKLEALLKQNHVFHIYFDGFKHNHIAHALIAVYSMGASPAELQAIYDQHSPIQKPPLPFHFSDPAQALADPATFTAHLGDDQYYSDYLAFFDHEIATHGVDQTFQTYYGSSSSAAAQQLRFQSLNGVLHGLIHVGYGLEMAHPLLLAEGLALCAVERPDYDPTTVAFTRLLFDPTARKNATGGGKSLLDVFDELHKARASFVGDSAGLDYTLDRARLGTKETSTLLETICSQWHVKADVEDVKAKLDELLNLTFHLYAGTMQNSHASGAPVFDFFLMHTLTSGFFLPLVISKFQTVELQATMLQVICRWFATEYVLAGLPTLHTPAAATASRPLWPELIQEAVKDEDEHVAKVIRALIKLDTAKGKLDPTNAYLKAAQDTIAFRRLQKKDKPPFWHMTGLGYKL